MSPFSDGDLFLPEGAESIDHTQGFSANTGLNLDVIISNPAQTIPDLNDPALNPNELIFDSDNLGFDPNFPISDIDTYSIASNDDFVDADLLIESSCHVGKDGQTSDVLRARDGNPCLPSKAEDFGLPLDLGTDSWWRRLLPQKKPSPPSIPGVQDVPQISPDTFREFSEEVGQEPKCPREFPIPCCSNYASGYQASFQVKTIYFIAAEDCAASTFLQASADWAYDWN